MSPEIRSTFPIPVEGLDRRFRSDAARMTTPTVLLVDDDAGVRVLSAAVLECNGFDVLEADGGRQALEVVRARSDVSLVLLDYEMPGMNGAAVSDEIRRLRPDLPILFLTGHAAAAALNGIPLDHIVEKPWRGSDLVRRIRTTLDRYVHPSLTA